LILINIPRIKCESSWFYLQDYTGMYSQQNVKKETILCPHVRLSSCPRAVRRPGGTKHKTIHVELCAVANQLHVVQCIERFVYAALCYSSTYDLLHQFIKTLLHDATKNMSDI